MNRTGGGCPGCLGLILCCLLLALAVAEAQMPAPTSAPAEGRPGAEDTYVVRKGDTLWGIAKGLLSDPILWPRIWDRNTFITDPNRIYPGDTLVIPGREAAPAPVVEAPKPPQEVPKEEVKALPLPAPEPPARPAFEAPPLPPVPPASPQAIACSPILQDEAVVAAAGVGSIVHAVDNRLLLSQEDQVSVGLDGTQRPNVGARLAVVRPGPRVVHPQTRQSLGRILFTLGVVEVAGGQDRTVQARIIYACDAINKGDRVAPFALAPFPADKVAQPAIRQVEGTIVESARGVQLYGLQHVVLLDVGEVQGIAPGDIFAIYRPNPPAANPSTGQVFPIAPNRRGEAVVIRVTDRTATAVLSASGKESQAGDRVVLSRQVQP